MMSLLDDDNDNNTSDNNDDDNDNDGGSAVTITSDRVNGSGVTIYKIGPGSSFARVSGSASTVWCRDRF